MSWKAVLASVLVALLALPAVVHADIIVGRETDADGFVGDLFAGTQFAGQGYNVASDGESPFTPFGAPFDATDGIQFNPNITWQAAAGSLWESLGNNTWVLRAVNENEPVFESLGIFQSDTPWNAAALGNYLILAPDGTTSDTIILANNAIGATLSFQSDPAPAPEPAGFTLAAIGIFSMAACGWLRRKNVA